MKTVNDYKTKAGKALHGKSVNKVVDIYSTMESVAEQINTEIDINESIRTVVIANAVYDSVSEYQLPDDIKPNGVISISPQAIDVQYDMVTRTTPQDFSIRKENDQFSIVTRNSKRFLILRKALTSPITVENCEDSSSFSIVAGVDTISDEKLNYIAGNQSIKLSITNSAPLSAVSMAIGDNSLAYKTMSATTGHFESFKQGWNMVRFDLKNSTNTGSPTMDNCQYMKLTFTTGISSEVQTIVLPNVDLSNYLGRGAIFIYVHLNSQSAPTEILIDSITANLGSLFVLEYYSKCMFISSVDGSWLTKPQLDGDFVISEESAQVFEAELCRHACSETLNGDKDYIALTRKLEGTDRIQGLYNLYGDQYPSQSKVMSSTYLDFEQNHGY